MKIELNITAPGLESALNNLAAALNGCPVKLTALQAEPIKSTVEETTSAPVETPAPEETESLTPAQKRKAELSKEIIALGGTPPEKGAVAKFEECLAALKSGEGEQTAAGSTEDPAPEETTTGGSAVPTLEETRMLASYIIKNQDDFDGKSSSLGKTKLGACVKKVGAKSITDLFEKAEESGDNSKILEFVAALEKNAKKTLAEVVAETSAE